MALRPLKDLVVDIEGDRPPRLCDKVKEFLRDREGGLIPPPADVDIYVLSSYWENGSYALNKVLKGTLLGFGITRVSCWIQRLKINLPRSLHNHSAGARPEVPETDDYFHSFSPACDAVCDDTRCNVKNQWCHRVTH
jgi:hypothetical protein